MVKMAKVHRGEVYLVDLEPARGREIQKAHPCVFISPDELNDHFFIAPLTTGNHSYPLEYLATSKTNAVTSYWTKFVLLTGNVLSVVRAD